MSSILQNVKRAETNRKIAPIWYFCTAFFFIFFFYNELLWDCCNTKDMTRKKSFPYLFNSFWASNELMWILRSR